MALPSNKKLSILYTLQILKDYSDEQHLLSQQEIGKKIYNIYGMECERKSIGTNIDSLIDFGYDIVKTKAGSFLASREFEPSEIRFLIDAVFSSKSIDCKHSRELANKLSNFLSSYQRKQYTYIYKANEINRSNNRELFYNIEIINEAIEKNKKIQFEYNRYYYKENKKIYIVNPYFLINNQGRYYLVCNFDYYNEIANYKVDFIKNIKILNDERKPLNSLKGYGNGIDITKYINDHIYPFADNIVKATIKLSDENTITYVMEWFGGNANVYKKGNNFFADITNNEKALIYWCLQYGESVELITPSETRNKIKEIVSKIQKKYD